MTSAEALSIIREAVRANRVRFSLHAQRDRMPGRGVVDADIPHAILNATACVSADRGCWKVIGPDQDGDELRAIVAIQSNGWVKIVTVTGD